jgi:hypothetical protein
VDPWIGFEYLKEKLQSRKWVSKEIIRGTMEKDLTPHLKAVSG